MSSKSKGALSVYSFINEVYIIRNAIDPRCINRGTIRITILKLKD